MKPVRFTRLQALRSYGYARNIKQYREKSTQEENKFCGSTQVEGNGIRLEVLLLCFGILTEFGSIGTTDS